MLVFSLERVTLLCINFEQPLVIRGKRLNLFVLCKRFWQALELLHRRRRIKRKSGRLIEFPSVRIKQEEEEEEEEQKKKKKKKRGFAFEEKRRREDLFLRRRGGDLLVASKGGKKQEEEEEEKNKKKKKRRI